MRAFVAFLACFLLSVVGASAQPSWYPASGTLTCNENFTGSVLNPNLWNFNHNGGVQYFGNGSMDIGTTWNYQMIPGGGVSLVARKQNFPVTNGTTMPYTSAYINTHNYGSVGCSNQLYGYFEAKVQMPPITGGANGLWPAYWALPAVGTSTWEMDFFERFTSEPPNPFDHTWVQFNMHYNSYANDAVICTMQDTNGWASQPHVFGVDWEPGSMQEYIDGNLCTDSTYNPTGTYTGAGIPATPSYILFDDIVDHVSNLAQEEQLSTQTGGDFNIYWFHVYQKNSNSQAQVQTYIAGTPTTDRPWNGASPPIYRPGDTITVTMPVTANASGDNGVYIAASLWDWCMDNGSSSSPCMYPYNNQIFGTTTNSATQNLTANQTANFTVNYTIPLEDQSKTPPIGYLYMLHVQACDGGGCNWSSNTAIQIGNVKP